MLTNLRFILLVYDKYASNIDKYLLQNNKYLSIYETAIVTSTARSLFRWAYTGAPAVSSEAGYVFKSV
ncbi:hypothetical protein GCM10027341_05450 [Spirosoma knui]